jgi:hypothetical protein
LSRRLRPSVYLRAARACEGAIGLYDRFSCVEVGRAEGDYSGDYVRAYVAAFGKPCPVAGGYYLYIHQFDDGGNALRALALYFMAAMVEAGDNP